MNDDFLKKLQTEARKQQKLYKSRIIPRAFDPITSFIGNNTFASLFFLALISSIVVELMELL